MSTLVTCGTGFVSRAFLHALQQRGERTRTIVRGTVRAVGLADEVVTGDVFNPDCVREAVKGMDTVVHVPPRVYPGGSEAAQLHAHRQVHVESTRLLLDSCVEAGVRRVAFISSALATGQDPRRILCELSAQCPASPYAQAKLEAEEVALSYGDRHGITVVVLRPPSIYGPGDKSIVSSLYRAAKRNLMLPLAGIEARQSIVFVGDLAQAGLALLDNVRERDSPRVFIVKDPVDYRPADLYAALGCALGRRAQYFAAPAGPLRIMGRIGLASRRVPWLRSWAMFSYLLTPRRYCDHLFSQTLPEFRFAGLNEAVRESIAHASA